ncbi:MAG: hypothetical protein KGJ07_04895 [Patescibacteria group bacterium]|nr:hypothetical protein [Patescibacteria group bacterium]
MVIEQGTRQSGIPGHHQLAFQSHLLDGIPIQVISGLQSITRRSVRAENDATNAFWFAAGRPQREAAERGYAERAQRLAGQAVKEQARAEAVVVSLPIQPTPSPRNVSPAPLEPVIETRGLQGEVHRTASFGFGSRKDPRFAGYYKAF